MDDNVRTLDETGWRVNEILELACPSRQNTDWSTGTTQYEGYDSYATDAIKRTLVDTGAVAIALEMDESLPREIAQGDFENAEPSGGFTYSTWCQYDAAETVAPNHAVTIVGWDDTIPASAFQGIESGNPPGNGAWLCKNNWGSDELYASLDASNSANHWGLRDEQGLASGFFWLSYYDHTITTPVAFKVTPTTETIENIYQYDFLSTSEFASPACYEATVKTANAFVANDIELLEAVTAWTFSPNETVTTEIYVLPVSKSASDAIDLTNGDEVFEEATLLQTTSQTFNTAGFHTINLDAPVFLAKGQRFLIAQQIKGTSTDDQGGEHDVNYLGLELAYSNPQSFYDQPTIASVVSNPGETYVMLLRNGWDTLEEHNAWYADLRDQQGKTVDIVYGNALAKALTSPTTMAGDAQVYETVPLEKTNNS